MNNTNKLKVQARQILSRLAIASGISLLPVFGFTVIAQAQTAANQTVNASMSGLLTIEVQEPTVNINFDLSTGAPATSYDLGDLVVRSNQRNGYLIQVSSTNTGELTNTNGDVLPYTLDANNTLATSDGAIGGGTYVSGVTPAGTSPGNDIYSSPSFSAQNCAAQSGCEINVDINFNLADIQALPGGAEVSDEITYTVSAQ